MISNSRTWKGCSAPVATSSRRGSSAITSLVSTSPSPITSPTPPPITLLSSCTPWLCLFFLLQTVSLSPFPQYFHQQLVTDGKIINAKNMIASIRACLLFSPSSSLLDFLIPDQLSKIRNEEIKRQFFVIFYLIIIFICLLINILILIEFGTSQTWRRANISRQRVSIYQYISGQNIQSLPSSTSSIPSSQPLSVSDVKQSAC